MRVLFALLALVAAAYCARAAETPVPRSVIEAAFKTADCGLELKEALDSIQRPQDLGAGLRLLQVKCEHGPYNVTSILIAFDSKRPRTARLLRFRIVDEKRQLAWQYSLTFAEYDPKSRRLRSFHKSRGLGDCGSAGSWRWTGKEFKLERYWIKADCDAEVFDDNLKDEWRVFPPRR